MPRLVGCNTFACTYGGMQLQLLNHIKYSANDYIIYADAGGPLERVFRALPNVKDVVFCEDAAIPDLVKKHGCSVFLHHTINHTDRKSIYFLKPKGIPTVVFHHCAWKPVYDSKYADFVITTSNSNIGIIRQNPTFLKKQIFKVPLSHDTSVYDRVLPEINPTTVKHKWEIPPDATVIGRIGRLEPCKCPEDFIRAAGILRNTSTDSLFFIIGGMLSTYERVKYLADLKKLIESVGLEEGKDIILTGSLTEEEKIGLLSVFDIYLYPTKWEGYCISFLEAMYCKKPVVTYDNLANAETVDAGGLVVTDGDVPGLVRSTTLLLRLPEMGTLLGSTGAALVAKRNNTKDYAWRIDEILERAGDPAHVNVNISVRDRQKKKLNICQVGYGLVDNMKSIPEYLQLVHMKRLGHNIDFFCTTRQGVAALDGVPINRGDVFDAALLKRRPDIIHVHHVENALAYPAAVYGYENSIPVVMNVHSITQSIEKYKKFVSKFVLFTDSECVTRGIGVDKEKVCVIPNGIDIAAYKQEKQVFDKNFINVLFVGQLFGWKGIYTLVDAAELVHAQNPGYCFHIVSHVMGEHKKLKEYIAGEGYINTYPSNHGERKFQTLVDMYYSSDIFCLPTENDCFPTTILEAMCCGLPVVATAVGGIPSQVDDNLTGYLVDPRSRYLAQTIASRLLQLGDAYGRNVMGAEGRAKVIDKFNITKTIQEYISLYRSFL